MSLLSFFIRSDLSSVGIFRKMMKYVFNVLRRSRNMATINANISNATIKYVAHLGQKLVGVIFLASDEEVQSDFDCRSSANVA